VRFVGLLARPSGGRGRRASRTYAMHVVCGTRERSKKKKDTSRLEDVQTPVHQALLPTAPPPSPQRRKSPKRPQARHLAQALTQPLLSPPPPLLVAHLQRTQATVAVYAADDVGPRPSGAPAPVAAVGTSINSTNRSLLMIRDLSNIGQYRPRMRRLRGIRPLQLHRPSLSRRVLTNNRSCRILRIKGCWGKIFTCHSLPLLLTDSLTDRSLDKHRALSSFALLIASIPFFLSFWFGRLYSESFFLVRV